MKKRNVVSLLIVLSILLTTNLRVSFAQDSPQWHLPAGAIARLGKGRITAIAYSPDGHRLAVAGSIGIWLYDTVTHQEVALLTGHTGYVFSVAFSPDGATLASGSWDDTVRLWDVATGTLRDTLTGHTSHVWSVAFSPDGTTLASGSDDRTVRLWDVATGTLRDTLTGYTGSVWSIAFSPDGTTLASGSSDNTVGLWDVATGTLRDTLTGHTGSVRSVAFSSDGTTLASGSDDNTVGLWDVATGTLRDTLTGHTSGVRSVAFSPDGTTIASGSYDGTVLLWRLTPTNGNPLTFDPSTVPDQMFTLGTSIAPLYLPIATGGTPPYTYTLDPIPPGLHFDATIQVLTGTPTTTGTIIATYTATDAAGASVSLTFTIEVTGAGSLDVDGDGQVTVVDLAIVALFYGTQVPVGVSLPADVNADGVVDLSDLTAVAQAIDAAGGANQLSLQDVELALLIAVEQVAELEVVAGAPMGFSTPQHVLSAGVAYGNVAAALSDARHLAISDVHLVKGMAVLEGLLQLLAEMSMIPETTALLPNYPNPFNPETWLPYQLAKAADVTLTVYDMRGVAVRQLVLGHQPAGVYQSRGRAAYWDGKNNFGEPVASGVYFYTLTAGDFSATRKMLIRK